MFKALAKEVGLDAVTFETCLGSRKFQAAIKEGRAEGNRVGVSGTPAFFINGRPVQGAHLLEAFVRVIDDVSSA